MRFVWYGKTNYHFLTDKQFDQAASAWVKGQSFYLSLSKIFLPPPRYGIGPIEEHRGKQIGWLEKNDSRWFPGWCGIQEDKSGRRVYVRLSAGDNFYWHEIEGDSISGGTFTPIDDCLTDPALRESLPFTMLLPSDLS